MTTENPWQVDSVQEFLFLKCPECKFDTKLKHDFQDHAIENHPLSYVLFDKEIKKETFEEYEGIDNHWDVRDADENYDNNENIMSDAVENSEIQFLILQKISNSSPRVNNFCLQFYSK